MEHEQRALAPAVQYVRMSTERQDLSVAFQKAAIGLYAEERGYKILRTYADEGVSGLSIDRREGLKRLLAEVLSDQPDFSTILVYDISRWGRFQNPDQAAHYEYLCAEAGVTVKYCAEPFENDGSMSATLLKSVKRVMAAEYSRELSIKIAQAKGQLGAAGFWQGGPPGYAYQLLTARFGGGRRLYALAGYRPTKVQESKFKRSWDETLTSVEAEDLRLRVLAGDDVPIGWFTRAPARAIET